MFLFRAKYLQSLVLVVLFLSLFGCANPADIPNVCNPGEQVCDGVNLKVCYLDGSGSVPLECPKNKPCFEGECTAPSQIPITKRKSCKAGEKVCYEGGVYACVADLSGFALIQACTNNEFCEGGRCQPNPVCSVGQKKCQGRSVMVCSDDRLSYRKLLSCQADERCEAGACKKLPVCKENEVKCLGGNVFKCSADRSQFEWSVNCVKDETCEDGKCVPLEKKGCVAGERNCSGNTVGLCDPNRGVFLPLTTCPSDQLCREGRCVVKSTCLPGKVICLGNTVQVCRADGEGYDFVANCSAGATCSGGSCTQRKSCTAATDCALPSQVCIDPVKRVAVPNCAPGHCYCAPNSLYKCLDGLKYSCGKFKCVGGTCK
ncbi:MAG TPA: hypothetical protein DCE42_05390 [Myxococcales bacterium]|nr:hypothetical protein [Deltaproteobacteria bacterium]MBU49740.1 hypothetical protein [Deltaproteobacteria bacterium]HAA54166.1 hypothetical protein [Myxococcales bacterium]